MSEYLSINPLREEFINNDEEYRYAYAEDFLNTYIATQIKVLRDKRGMTQKDLAEAIGTKQPGIARLENVNYSNWKTETLKKIARAFGVRLKITFETFGSLLDEDATFSRKELERDSFEEDRAFKEDVGEAEAVKEGVDATPVHSHVQLPYPLKVIEGKGNRTPIQPSLRFMHEVTGQNAPPPESMFGAQARPRHSGEAEVEEEPITLAMAASGR